MHVRAGACACDHPGKAFVLGLRGHLAPLPVLVISLFPTLSCRSIPSLSVSSSPLSSSNPFIPPSPTPPSRALPLLCPRRCRPAGFDQGARERERKWVRKLCWRLQENKAGISSRGGWETARDGGRCEEKVIE